MSGSRPLAVQGIRMPEITREQLSGYLDDALSDSESALVEQALRQSDALRRHIQEELGWACRVPEHGETVALA